MSPLLLATPVAASWWPLSARRHPGVDFQFEQPWEAGTGWLVPRSEVDGMLVVRRGAGGPEGEPSTRIAHRASRIALIMDLLVTSFRSETGQPSSGSLARTRRTLEVGELRRLVFEKMPQCASVGTYSPTSYPRSPSVAPTWQRTPAGMFAIQVEQRSDHISRIDAQLSQVRHPSLPPR